MFDRFVVFKEEVFCFGSMFLELFCIIVELIILLLVFVIVVMEKELFWYDDLSFERIVFIGDVNYVVSVFVGNGVNLVLKDGWDLVENICY